MHVTIARVHENLFAGEALSLTAPTTEGEVTILPHHEPLVANLKPGSVIVRTEAEEKRFEVTDGVLEVSGNQATVLL
jgi:F-type H+-transporting ATPase subunit epsilon